jgi:DNA polymerase III alpha subunit
MAFVTLEDLQGSCDVVVFPRVWAQTKDLWQPENILVVGGKIDAGRRDEPNLLCDWAKVPDQVALPAEQERPPLPEPPPSPAHPVSGPRVVRVTLTRSKEAERDVQTLRQVHALLAQREGQDHFRIRVVNGAGKVQELMFPNITTCYTPELERKLIALVGEGAVRVEEGIV